MADTSYELPFDFRVEKASESETRVCGDLMAEVLSDEEVRECCVDFVADRGLDSEALRRQHGGDDGNCRGLSGKEQARQDA